MLREDDGEEEVGQAEVHTVVLAAFRGEWSHLHCKILERNRTSGRADAWEKNLLEGPGAGGTAERHRVAVIAAAVVAAVEQLGAAGRARGLAGKVS